MKIYLDTIGCRLNQAEIEIMAGQFRAAGHEIASSAGEADLAVVNTCAVTAEAASDSRGKIRHIAGAGVQNIIATGCWVTLQPREAQALPGVSKVIPNLGKDDLVWDVLGQVGESFEIEPIARRPIPGLRRRTRAFIKVQDGCDNHCTFCVTTLARGASRSRSTGAVLRDIRAVVQGGGQEAVLTGVHLGSWGRDFGRRLRDLVEAILRETDIPRLRLSSLEPWDLDEDFLTLWQDARLCRHLHLPLQSGCAATLRRMARKTSPESFRKLVEAARRDIPEVAVTTDVIAGFPGESETEFAESLAFVREMDFAGGHAFTYSARPGTAAARLPGQVPSEIRKQRNAAYRQVFEAAGRNYRQNFLGRRMPVLWEAAARLDRQGWQIEGWTDNYLRVSAQAARPLWNEISDVLLQSAAGDHLTGVIDG